MPEKCGSWAKTWQCNHLAFLVRAKLAYLAYQLEVQDTSAKRENVKAAGGRKFYEVATAFNTSA